MNGWVDRRTSKPTAVRSVVLHALFLSASRVDWRAGDDGGESVSALLALMLPADFLLE